MKLLLLSDFRYVGEKYIKKFFKNGQTVECLIINYANEENEPFELSGSYEKLKNLPYQMHFTNLTKDSKIEKRPDMIFVRGGNTAKLLYELRLYNQFDMIKRFVQEGSLYVGISAGSVLAGSDIFWTLRSEPYEKDLNKEFPKFGYKGFGFVDKLVFVHTSKYRIVWKEEKQNPNEKDYRVFNKEFYADYLIDRKLYNSDEFIKIGNNQALFCCGEKQAIKTYDWSKLEIKK